MAEVKEFELKISTKQAQENVDELNKSLEAQVDLIDEIEKELSGYEKKLTKTSKTNLAARKSLNDKIQQTKERLKDEKVGLKDVTKERNKSNKTLKEATKNSADYSGVLGMIDSKTGGLVSGITRMTTGIGGATKGLKLMKIAIIGTGIGALLIAITALGAAFTGSEEGQNKFAKIMAVIGALTGNIVDLFADLGESIISAFENPKEALNSFIKLIKDNLITRFEGLLNLIPSIGKAVDQLFKGNFSEAGKIAADAVGKVTLGVDSVTDSVTKATEAVKGFVKEQVEEGKAAASVADMRAKADKIERDLIVKRSKLESEVALLRLKSRQEEEFTATERKAALLEAQKLEEQLLEDQTEYLTLRRDAQVLENTFSRSNKENLDKEAEAIAAVNRQIASRANTARQVQREVNTIQGQIETEQKAADAIVKADAKAIADFKKGLIEVDKNDKLAAIEKEKADRVLALEDLKVSEAQKNDLLLEIDAAYNAKKEVLDEEAADKEEKAAKEAADELVKIEKDKAAQKAAIQAAQINMVSQGIALLKQVAGKNKALQAAAIIGESAVGIAKTVISTQAANAGALMTPQAIATSGAAAVPVIVANKISAGIGIAANLAATRKALQGLKAGGSPPPPPASISGASVTAASTQATPPEFNTVGASGTNQLADAIGSQTKQPIKTYVVASDVTTAQNLERNIITGATVG